jgi:formate C-acetyltransferase
MDYKQPSLRDSALRRISALKRAALSVEQQVCPERARYFTAVYRENLSDPIIIKRALALENTLAHMTIRIDDGELIAGNQASTLRAAPIYPEFTVGWILEEIDELDRRPGDRFHVTPGVREELIEICTWWQGRTVHDRCLRMLPDEVLKAYDMGVLSARGNMTSGDGHIILDFPKVLRVGVRGIIEEAEDVLRNLDPTDPATVHKRLVLQSVIITYRSVISFAERFAAMAGEKAENCDGARKTELQEMADICARVPAHPPKSFKEALQSVWFVHLISQIESNGHSMSLGRFDQYMYPYYRRDREEGVLNDDEVAELLALLWIKMFGITKIRPWAHTRFSGGGPTYQNLTLGGITPEGRDAVNELTMLCLDAVSLTRLPQPNVSARYHPLCDASYLRKCVEVIKLGFGMPAMHNDELMIPSLLNRQVRPEDANDYAVVGCIEPIIPGRHGYRAAGMSFTNFPKILEIVLAGGTDPRTGIRLLDGKGDLASFENFEQVMDAFSDQMAYFVKLRIMGEHIIDTVIEEMVPEPFCTGLIQDCIQRAKTPKEGGAVYDMVTGPETGVTNVGNSLASIKKLVFEEGLITGAELKQALDSDFSGPDGERVRQLLINRAPKFGNDDDYVDTLTSETYMIFIRELAKYRNTRYGRGPIGGINYPCTATISGNVPSGRVVGASPDGRRAGEPLAEGCSPYHGTDKIGPTAVIQSVAKMPNILITGGNLLNQRLEPSALETEEGMKKLEDMIRTFFELMGWHIQFNVISSQKLRDAQRTPQDYGDLVVRVAGYSALFTVLEPATQEDIIARTAHSL